jgi:hypothetical protein
VLPGCLAGGPVPSGYARGVPHSRLRTSGPRPRSSSPCRGGLSSFFRPPLSSQRPVPQLSSPASGVLSPDLSVSHASTAWTSQARLSWSPLCED